MMPRKWFQFYESIKGLLEPDELERFLLPNAEEFYNKLRMLCSLQVENYWKEFLVKQKEEMKEAAMEANELPPGALEAKIQAIVKAEMAEELTGYTQYLMGEIKKLLREQQNSGEDWKKDKDDPTEGDKS